MLAEPKNSTMVSPTWTPLGSVTVATDRLPDVEAPLT